MARFRMVHTEFWNDPMVMEEMTPEDKYFFLYLLTNPNTTQIGIYEITKKQMAFDMGYSIETINSLLDRFLKHHKLIKYNSDTREVAIRNWGKYNLIRGGKPMLDCVSSELKEVKDSELVKYVSEAVPNDNIRKLYDTWTIRGQEEDKEKEEDKEEESNKKPKKSKYGEFKNVLLTDDEYKKLTERFPSDFKERIERVSGYVASTGKSYKSHYATIINWAKKDNPAQSKKKADTSWQKQMEELMD